MTTSHRPRGPARPRLPEAKQEEIIWREVLHAALNGLRCPSNEDWSIGSMGSHALGRLARRGWLRIEVSGKNWRTVYILHGPHAGKSTKAGPPGHTYLIIDRNGRLDRTHLQLEHRRQA